MKNTTNKLSEPAITFLKFVRAKMLTKVIRKGDEESKSVQISQSDIERFFVYPKYNKKAEIQALIDMGELKFTTVTTSSGYKLYCYEAKPGAFDISLLKPTMQKLDAVTEKIKSYLRLVSLPPDAPSTTYFDLFLKHCDQYIDLFFSVDNFSGRIHTPVSSFHATHRPNILIEGQSVTSFDVAQSQPTILAKILTINIGDNQFSQWVDSGKDIYMTLKEKAGLKERKEAKDLLFKILFSKPNESLVKFFGNANWITWINKYKACIDSRNPNNEKKPHSNMAWLLQMTEVLIMQKIWKELVGQNIPFLTVHDEIICSQTEAITVRGIIDGILSKEYPVYKLNTSQNLTPPLQQKVQPITVQPPIELKQNVLWKQESLILESIEQEFTPLNTQPINIIAFVDEKGKLFIKTPFAKTFSVYNSVNEYNNRLCPPSFENIENVNTANMTKADIDSETLTIKQPI